jgi:fucose permease
MTAKISIFIWAPQYVEAKFGVGAEESGRFMGNIFTAALVGSLVGTWLVSRIKVKILLYALVLIAGAATIAFTRMATLESMMIIALFFGVSISATFNAYMAFALTLVKIPTHRNIAYMLLMSGLGSAIAPLVSSQAVARGGEIQYALYICAALFLMVILTLFASEFADQNRTSS